MRQPAEKVKEVILHVDQDVRDAAAYYFADSYSDDASVMPLVIQAIEKYGFEAAFTGYSFLTNLVQTDETVVWLSGQLKKLGQPTNEKEAEPVLAYNAAVIHADPDVLKNREAEIRALEALDPDSKDVIRELIEFRSRSADELWTEFVEFGEALENDDSICDEDYDLGCRLVEALGRFRDQFAAQVLDVISGETNELGTWKEGFAIRLAGEMKLAAAIPLMMATLEEGAEDWISDECHRAFTKIGSQSVIAHFARDYAKSEWLERMAIASTLENIHSDESVQACFDFLKSEEDEEIRGILLESILFNFCPGGVEPARQFILSMPLSPDVLEVRSALLTACKLMGGRFPEFDAWLEDCKNDPELRQKWYDEHPLPEDDEELEEEDFEDEDFEEEDFEEEGFGEVDFEEEDLEEDEYEEPIFPPSPIVRKSERVGRNDPCPCGSGKKYKKCCYGKDSAEEADSFHSSAMGEIAPGERTTKFPIGTLAQYGPNAKITTKIVAGIIKRDGAEPILERWVGTNIKDNPKVQRQIQEFFQKHGVKSVVATDANIGCPHEEGQDFPLGEDFPFCPFWKGKQGSNQKD